MAEHFFLYTFNMFIVLAYALCSYVSYLALLSLQHWHSFTLVDLKNMIAESVHVLCGDPSKAVNNRLGWFGLYIGAMLISGSSAMLSLMHLEYLITGDVLAVGVRDSVLWFCIHTFNIGGSLAVWYWVAKARLGVNNEDD